MNTDDVRDNSNAAGKADNAIAPTPLYMTPGARDCLHPQDLLACIARHFAGDWGELCEDDRAENVIAVRDGMRIFSV